MKKIIVKENGELFTYLRNNLSESKNNIKSFLKNNYIKVNGKLVTAYDYVLKVNDVITIGNNFINYKDFNIEILYEDKDIIVVNKPYNLLSIATTKEKEITLYSIISKYVKEENKNNKIFIVHRLDKDTSGVILFAKNIKTKDDLQKRWKSVKRLYVGVVHGISSDKDIIKVKLKENPKSLMTYVSEDGVDSITKYQKIKNSRDKSMLLIDILTGKKNQIRVSLSYKGLPLLGDKKYGLKDTYKRLYLHAYKLILDGKEFVSDIPKEFEREFI